MRRSQDQQSRVFYELCALILDILRSPPLPIPFTPSSSSSSSSSIPNSSSSSLTMAPSSTPPPTRRGASSTSQVSPAAFASLLLGISLALMLCGSVTFVIGFILMPWVLGLVMFFYFLGIVSNLSVLGRSIFCPTVDTSAAPSSRKEVPAWNFS